MEDKELINIFLDGEMFKKLKEIAEERHLSIEVVASMFVETAITQEQILSAFDDLVDQN